MLLIQLLGADGADQMVEIEHFYQFLEWFGPADKNSSIINRVFHLLSRPYFHGFITTTKAQQSLSNKKKGTYVVRFSLTEPGAFSISSVSDHLGHVVHYRMSHKIGKGFAFGDSMFSSIDDIIRYIHFILSSIHSIEHHLYRY